LRSRPNLKGQGQTLEAEVEARTLRSRPNLRGQGQTLEIEAKFKRPRPNT